MSGGAFDNIREGIWFHFNTGLWASADHTKEFVRGGINDIRHEHIITEKSK